MRLIPLRGTSYSWATSNPVLGLGELALEEDTLNLKMGNGVTPYNLLGYLNLGDTIMSAIASGRPKSDGGVVYPVLPGCGSVTLSPITRAVDTIYYEPMLLESGVVLDELWIEVTTLAASGLARLGIYSADTDWQPVGNALVTSAALDTSTTGIKKATGLGLTLPAGRYLRTSRYGTAAPSVRAARGSTPGAAFLTTLGASAALVAYTKAQAYAATFNSPGTKWDTVAASSTPFENTVFCILSSVT